MSSHTISVEDKLETPEERLGRSITLRDRILLLWGPAVIALGVSIGSGEFLIGPSVAIKTGLGLAWLVLIGAFLQTIYIYSWVRLVAAYGETPIAMLFRIHILVGILGALFVPLSFIWGGWAATSAAAATSLIVGGVPGPEHRPIVITMGIALLILTFIILTLGHRVARTLEVFNWLDLGFLFPAFIILAVILTPLWVWGELAKGIVSFGYIPPGVDLVLLGAFWGYTGYATGINYILANYFKDKGYGMAAKTGYIPAIVGGKTIHMSPTGRLFRLTPENLEAYRRWIRIATEELVFIFFIGALIGMWIPMTLSYAIARGLGLEITWGIPAWLGLALRELGWGSAGFIFGVIVAILVLLKTQLGVVDAVVRALVDGFWRLESVRSIARNDVRVIYYAILAIYLAWASLAMFFRAPFVLILIAANAANAAAILGVPALIYLNYKVVPKELRLHPILIILNSVFMVLCLVFLVAAVGRTLGYW
ncbi:MAG: Nramp family divalent metal transporter [Acidilobaceae archaeon]